MTSLSGEHEQGSGGHGLRSDFPTTHWTLVMRIREGGPVRQAALEELCRLYWYPIYVFLRRRGYGQHDAEDFTQGFFLKLLGDESLSAAEAGRARLRTFLLQHLKRHLADQKRFDGAVKRGGGHRTISFDEMHAEERYAREPVDQRDPERRYLISNHSGFLPKAATATQNRDSQA